MPRKILIDSRELPYHINAKANNREPFPGDLEFVWKTITSELYLQVPLYEIRIHAFVLMPNHFHLLLTTPNIAIHKSMKELLSSSTRIINTRNRRWGRVFGGRYHWSSIDNPLYYAHAFKYVYRNPVKANLCQSVADYRFSTFSGLSGSEKLPLPIRTPLRNLDAFLPSSSHSNSALEAWLNQPHRQEENTAIKIGLKKKWFAPATNRSNRKKVILTAPD